MSRAANSLYNARMHETPLAELKHGIEFTQDDEMHLRALGEEIFTHMPHVSDRLFEQVRHHPQALAVFTAGEDRIARQRVILSTWLEELLSGSYGDEYHHKRLKIGRTHVKVALPQHFMLGGIEFIRQELDSLVRQEKVKDADTKLSSLHKLLMLDLAIMLEGYKDAYALNIRETERSAVKEKLTRAEHLAEIGQLAASLAHEIKNPLAGISGAIQIIGGAMSEDDPHRPIIGEILGQIRRLDAAVKDLLVYARPTPPRATEFDLDKVIRRVLAILHEEPAVQRVRIKYSRAAAVPPGRGDEAQLEQLLMNLIINAADASDANEVVRVSTTYDHEEITFTVQDCGCGMTPEVHSRAFEPFFTTKAKGTGLGLSICRRIIDAHGGKVSIDSSVGEGTTVIVSLPRAIGAGLPSGKTPKAETSA